ncbi:MAG: LPD7 domain-containing protein [Campylobacter lanienae]|nr:hypothetical protein [Campylobacteraceae bacterium]MDY2817179.1 LPD7 domain-containing protein [Campylobacter lanienae]
MSQISSINFKKSVDYQVFHNSTIRPSYVIGGELECDPPKGYDAQRIKNEIIENAKQAYFNTSKARNKAFQAKNYEWSAVVNIKPETTMNDLKTLAQHFSYKYGFQCYQIAIHRDEGHINDNGEKEINHHAHLEFITLDKNTGKQLFKLRDFNPQKMREIQTEVAEILQMERGQDKRISGAKRIEPRAYARLKEQERQEKREIKKELESTKETLKNTTQELETTKKELKALSANAIRKRVEQERKAWLNTNKALHEQGAEPIFTAEHYKELRELGKKAFTSLDELENALKELEKRIRKEKRQNQSNKPQISTTKKDFKSRLIDEYYSDLSTKHDLTPFYFNKELKTLENKQKGYKIKDSENTLTLTTSKKADLSEQVALMLDMAKSKGWELDSIKVTGSKAFCDEVARQIAEIKVKEKAEQERKLKELEQENERLKAELANNRTEIALETQNEPKPSQDITQSEKTQETAPKAKSQEQIDLETIQKLDKQSFLDEKQAYELKSILERLNLEQDIKTLETLECERIKNNKEKISTPYLSMQNAIRELDKLTAQEKAKKEQKDAELKRVNEQQKEMERQKAQGNFNYSTKSQSQDKSRNF